MKKWIFSLLSLAVFSPLQAQQEYKAPENTRFRIIGYAPSYRNLDAIPDRSLAQLDIACYAFATIDSTGIPRVRDEKHLRRFVRKARRAGVEVMLSFNGRHAYYARMVSSAQSRARFIDALWHLVKKYRLAGVDNDWEYPKTSDNSHTGNTALMRELSAWLHDPAVNKLLTMAITPGVYEGAVSNGIETECFDYVDWFNIMCYDSYLGWADKKPEDLPLEMLTISYNYWVVKRSMPKYKFVGGISVYGRPSDEKNNGTAFTYSGILAQGGDPDGYKAHVSSSSYTGDVYYNGRTFVQKKTRYCIDQGVGGIMFWEVGQDVPDDRSLVKAAYDELDGYTDLP